MIKNKEGRIQMHPYPEIGKGKLFLVGETVFLDEIREGKYFMSQGAEALRTTLKLNGIDLDECVYSVAIPYIMNKLKTISPEAWETHKNRIWKEIEDSGAELVMPLGTIATQLVLGDKQSTITKMLGNIIERNGVKIIPNYHPASMNHNPGNYKVFQKIIESTSKFYQGFQMDPGITKEIVIDSKELLVELCTLCADLDYVACDIETNSLVTWQAEMWVIGVTTTKNLTYVIPRHIILEYPELVQELFNSKCKWIWHNGKYDASVLHWNNYKSRIDEDTMLLHYCLNETSGTHGLGACATMYLGADEYKSEMNAEFSHIMTEADYTKYKSRLITRVAVDADYTYQLYEIFKPLIEANQDWSKLYNEMLIPGAAFLKRVQINGIHVDIPYLEARVPDYEKKIEETTVAIQEAATPFYNREAYMDKTGAKSGSEIFKPTSVKQMKYLVWDVLKLKPTIRCKRGATGADVLESILNPPDFILKVLELRKIKKEFTAFCKSYIEAVDADDLIHCNFSQHSTATGRLSCTNPNLQQVPSSKPEIRRAFTPRGPGRIIMEVDYSGAELRVLAWISQDETMIKAVTTGDLHSEVAEKIFGKEFTKVQRGMAKTINFGIAYGRGGDSIEEAFDLPKGEGAQMIKMWAELYPKAWAYLESCIEDVKAGRPLITPYGRYRRVGLVSPKALAGLSNEAKNFRIQSISSDNTVLSAMYAEEALLKHNAFIVNLIHDSILIDAPADPKTVKNIADIMIETMEGMPHKMFGCNVDFHCDCDLGPNWGDNVSYDRVDQTVTGKNGKIKYEEYVKNGYKI